MARRSQRLIDAKNRLPRTREVWFCVDLHALILSFTDWPTLISVSRIDRHDRDGARFEVRYRFRLVLRPFLPHDDFDIFIDMLALTGGAVVGSAVFNMLLINMGWRAKEILADLSAGRRDPTFSMDLNLLIPAEHLGECIRWWYARGYTDVESREISYFFNLVGVTKFIRMSKRSDFIPLLTEVSYTVYITPPSVMTLRSNCALGRTSYSRFGESASRIA